MAESIVDAAAAAFEVLEREREAARRAKYETLDRTECLRRLTRRERRMMRALCERAARRGDRLLNRRETELYWWLLQRGADRDPSELSWWQTASVEEADKRWKMFVETQPAVLHPMSSHRQDSTMQERRRFRRSRARGSSVVAEPVEVAAPPVLVEAEPEPEVVYVPPTPPADVLSTPTRPHVRMSTRSLMHKQF